jgi:TonB-dependent starch-binding outer membrane protein SusC
MVLYQIRVTMKDSRTILTLLFGILAGVIFAQQRNMNGIVSDAQTKEPVIGASILIKGTGQGTITEFDGTFQLQVDQGNVLVISYVGFASQEIVVGNQTTLEIFLVPESVLLNQVVVVGYGAQRKVDITGSTVSVKGEELAKQPVMTATQALQGKVAGVQIISSGKPGSSPSVRIRGVGTALAGTTTLFVVDGILTDDISNINTADIVNMDVLKDASSTAIYGARGANGVVIITTKKGTSGATRINYNNFIGVRNATNLVTMANAEEYANYATVATGKTITAGDADTDWYKEILRNAWTHNHNISLSGGTEKNTHYLGFGLLDENGIVLNNKFRRLNIRTNLDYKLSEYLSVGINGSYTSANERDVNLGTAYNNAYRAAPIIPGKIEGRYGNTSQYQNVGNPILDLSNNDNKGHFNRMQASAYLEIKPLKGLIYKSLIGTDLSNGSQRRYNYRFLNDEETFLTAGGNQRSERSSLSVTNDNSFRWVLDNILSYRMSINKNSFTIMAATTAEAYADSWAAASRQDVPAVKDLWYITTGNANTSTNNGSGDKWARNSYLSRINYNYNNKYVLTATIRADGSSRMQRITDGGSSLLLAWVGLFPANLLCRVYPYSKHSNYGLLGEESVTTGYLQMHLRLQ